jgi:hypothetical protein
VGRPCTGPLLVSVLFYSSVGLLTAFSSSLTMLLALCALYDTEPATTRSGSSA